MRTDPLPYEVRQLVALTFQELDVDFDGPWDVDETILIDDGRCAGRTYRAGGHMAMWLIDIGIVQFYDPDGNMLQTINLLKELEFDRMAA
jgi:hypothetical protein